VRTALYSWLFAKSKGGEFLLRIEDTDLERSTQESVDAILEGMNWLGLDFEEEVVFQSNRFDIYQKRAEELIESGHAYKCYCTPGELEEMRSEQIKLGKNPGYDGRCRDKAEQAGDCVIRLKSEAKEDIIVNDLVYGQITVHKEELDDFIILRSNGVPTYHFAVVIDDNESEITHVLRGDDHLKNSAKHIQIMDAMGFDRPQFIHLPMILGSDGSRLSKRHGAMNILEYNVQGFLPEAVLNYLVRLGWSFGDQEIFTVEEMIDKFDVKNLNKSSAKFDLEKLTWLNQQHLMNTHHSDLAEFLTLNSTLKSIPTAEILISFVEAYKSRVNSLNELLDYFHSLYAEDFIVDDDAAQKFLKATILEPLQDLVVLFDQVEWNPESIHQIIADTCEKHDMGFGKIGQPLRVAITGGTQSPSIDLTITLLDRDNVISRLKQAIQYIGSKNV
jgi:glutamyl-tRNA synthetase